MQERRALGRDRRFQTAFIFMQSDPFAHAPGRRVLLLFSPAPLGSVGRRSRWARAALTPRSAGLRHFPLTQQMSAATVPESSPRSFQRRAHLVPERGPSTQKRPPQGKHRRRAPARRQRRGDAPPGAVRARRPQGYRDPAAGRGCRRAEVAAPTRSALPAFGPCPAEPRSAAPRSPQAERSPRSRTAPVPTRCGSPWPAASAGACAAPASWRCAHARSSGRAPPPVDRERAARARRGTWEPERGRGRPRLSAAVSGAVRTCAAREEQGGYTRAAAGAARAVQAHPVSGARGCSVAAQDR